MFSVTTFTAYKVHLLILERSELYFRITANIRPFVRLSGVGSRWPVGSSVVLETWGVRWNGKESKCQNITF
jgi:hypothetical protein